MTILPKDIIPSDPVFSAAIAADITNGTQLVVLVRDSVETPIHGMMIRGNVRFVLKTSFDSWIEILDTDDIVIK